MKNLFNITDNEFTKIYKTYDYSKFNLMEDNRIINMLHVNRLISSFNEQYLVCPIIVNDKMEIIDGQHRFTACKEANLPLYYYIIDGYGSNEVRKLNTNQKNWTRLDYLEAYASQQIQPYVLFKKFMSDFPDFGFQSCERMLSGLLNSRQQTIAGVRTKSKYFEEGKFFIPDLKKSYKTAEKLLEFRPYYKNFHRSTFVTAMMGLFDSNLYNHDEMIKKLKHYPNQIVDCVNIDQYRALIEDIYNRRRQEKVSFKYL